MKEQLNLEAEEDIYVLNSSALMFCFMKWCVCVTNVSTDEVSVLLISVPTDTSECCVNLFAVWSGLHFIAYTFNDA